MEATEAERTEERLLPVSATGPLIHIDRLVFFFVFLDCHLDSHLNCDLNRGLNSGLNRS